MRSAQPFSLIAWRFPARLALLLGGQLVSSGAVKLQCNPFVICRPRSRLVHALPLRLLPQQKTAALRLALAPPDQGDAANLPHLEMIHIFMAFSHT